MDENEFNNDVASSEGLKGISRLEEQDLTQNVIKKKSDTGVDDDELKLLQQELSEFSKTVKERLKDSGPL